MKHNYYYANIYEYIIYFVIGTYYYRIAYVNMSREYYVRLFHSSSRLMIAVSHETLQQGEAG